MSNAILQSCIIGSLEKLLLVIYRPSISRRRALLRSVSHYRCWVWHIHPRTIHLDAGVSLHRPGYLWGKTVAQKALLLSPSVHTGTAERRLLLGPGFPARGIDRRSCRCLRPVRSAEWCHRRRVTGVRLPGGRSWHRSTVGFLCVSSRCIARA